MKYLSFLRELFSEPEFATSHIVLATHSHFIISDLVGKNSKIIGLKKDDINNNIIVDLPKNLDTYGWSAEDVLFRIFNMKSTRNHYFEMAVADLLDLVYTKSKDANKIDSILKELKELKISENDPLNELIEETEQYLDNDKSNN